MSEIRLTDMAAYREQAPETPKSVRRGDVLRSLYGSLSVLLVQVSATEMCAIELSKDAFAGNRLTDPTSVKSSSTITKDELCQMLGSEVTSLASWSYVGKIGDLLKGGDA